MEILDFDALYQEALKTITEIEDTRNTREGSKKQQADIAIRYLVMLKKQVLEKEFTTRQEEISFFKRVKPRFSALSFITLPLT